MLGNIYGKLFEFNLYALIASSFIFIKFVNAQEDSNNHYTPYKDAFDFFVNALVPFFVYDIAFYIELLILGNFCIKWHLWGCFQNIIDHYIGYLLHLIY